MPTLITAIWMSVVGGSALKVEQDARHAYEKQATVLVEAGKPKIRFIRVVLDNGDIEVLATSFLDNTLLTTKDFKLLYHLRWEIKIHYDVIKNRPNLENFTGLSAPQLNKDFCDNIYLKL